MWCSSAGRRQNLRKLPTKSVSSNEHYILFQSLIVNQLRLCADAESDFSSVDIKTITVDFTDGNSIYSKIEAELSQLEVGILVNNVGMAVGFAERFAEIADEKSLNDIVNCNILSMVCLIIVHFKCYLVSVTKYFDLIIIQVRMSRLILPQMIERKRGVIVNIGSISGAFSTPLATIYGATKVCNIKRKTNFS